MKTFKRIFATLMIATLILGLGITAFAEGYSVTVKNTPSNTNVSIVDKTFYAYKIFDVTYSGANYSYTISNSDAWWTAVQSYMGNPTADANGVYTGSNITLTPTVADPNKYVVATAAGFDPRAFADFLTGWLKTNPQTPDGTATGAEVTPATDPITETAKISLTAPGYYMVTGESDTTEGTPAQTVVAATALDTADPDAEIELKAEAPKLDKEIIGGNGNSNGTSAQVGDTVNFKLTSNVPDTNGYNSYTYIVSDTLSDGLTLNIAATEAETFTVKVNGTVVPLTKAATEAELVGDKYYLNGQTFKISLAMLTAPDTAKYTTGQPITIEYSATVNENALTVDKETNTATLTYSSNPYDESKKNDTPETTVYVYDFDIIIDKYKEGATDTKLANAKFVLLNSANKYYKYTAATASDPAKVEWVDNISDATEVTTDANGAASFQGLEVGTYYLRETAAPAGYNLLTEDVTVTITTAYNDDGTLQAPPSSSVALDASGRYSQTVQVANNTGTILPATGGIGTTIFYVVGSILVIGTAVLLITRKRMNDVQ